MEGGVEKRGGGRDRERGGFRARETKRKKNSQSDRNTGRPTKTNRI